MANKKATTKEAPEKQNDFNIKIDKISDQLDVTEKYKDIINSDLLEPIMPLLRSRVYFFTRGGRIDCKRGLNADTPWVHIRQAQGKDCGLWHQVWFNHYGFIPFGCQSCWKVVVRPRTLKEMFELYELMKFLDLPSKLGIERRFSVPALFGAYFYNNSYEDGQQCYKFVREAVSQALSPDVKVILKRGCTEMEHAFGDSTKWMVSEEQAGLEKRLSDLFLPMTDQYNQPDAYNEHVMAGWIKFAFAGGDPTAAEFSSEPLFPPYVTYHDKDAFAEEG